MNLGSLAPLLVVLALAGCGDTSDESDAPPPVFDTPHGTEPAPDEKCWDSCH